ncbi:glycogen debranching enzyme, partial [filamentous cyanobacterium CCP1]
MKIHHTYTYGNFVLLRGQPFPFGATPMPGGVNFSIYSSYATAITLVLFKKEAFAPFAEILIPREFRLGNVACITVMGLDYEDIEYGYRVDGPYNPKAGHRFDSSKILLDPYARCISGRDVWGDIAQTDDVYPYRPRVIENDFDWEGDH